MKSEMRMEKVKKQGTYYLEKIENASTKYGEGKVERLWLGEEFCGYRVQAGYRKIWGDLCDTIFEAVNAYERKEKSIRERIRDIIVK